MGLIHDVRMLRKGRDWRGRSTTPRSAERWAPRREHGQFPTGWARSAPARVARTAIQRGVLYPLVRAETQAAVHGADQLDDLRGPVVFVANHASHIDTPLILGSLPHRFARRTAVGAAADYFFDARWRAVATALAFNAFPIERRGSRRARTPAPGLIDDGWSLLLFPEGTRSADGWMRQFRLGAAALCCQKGIPAVPLVVRGTFAAMPRGRGWPRPGRPSVVVRYGKPLYPEAAESVRDFGARLEHEVSRLWVEHDTSWWTSLRTAEPDRVPRGPEVADWRRTWEATRPLPRADRPRVWEASRRLRRADQARTWGETRSLPRADQPRVWTR
jgi:1-acyl-sn-glycerol-3-phosphate acyltransferase